MCNASEGQVVSAYGHRVASSNEQPGWCAPCSIDRTLSHRRWMEIGPGGEAKEVHTCLRLLWTHMGAGISTHAHTEREGECVLGIVCLLTSMDAYCSLGRRWASYGWQYGAYRGGDLLSGLFSSVVAVNSWISSTSPHVLSWCSLQMEMSPTHIPCQTGLQCFLSCFIITWMVAILLYTVWLLLASHSKSLACTWWANNSRWRRNFCFSGSKSS